MIAIVDYAAGNLASVKKALDRVSSGAVVTSDPEVVAKRRQDRAARSRTFFSDAALDEAGLR